MKNQEINHSSNLHIKQAMKRHQAMSEMNTSCGDIRPHSVTPKAGRKRVAAQATIPVRPGDELIVNKEHKIASFFEPEGLNVTPRVQEKVGLAKVGISSRKALNHNAVIKANKADLQETHGQAVRALKHELRKASVLFGKGQMTQARAGKSERVIDELSTLVGARKSPTVKAMKRQLAVFTGSGVEL